MFAVINNIQMRQGFNICFINRRIKFYFSIAGQNMGIDVSTTEEARALFLGAFSLLC